MVFTVEGKERKRGRHRGLERERGERQGEEERDRMRGTQERRRERDAVLLCSIKDSNKPALGRQRLLSGHC